MELARNHLFDINSIIVQNIVNRQAATMILNKQKDYILEMLSSGLLTSSVDAEEYFHYIIHDLQNIEKIKQIEFKKNLQNTRNRRRHQQQQNNKKNYDEEGQGLGQSIEL